MTNDDVVAIRFYEWCLLDAAREQREGFALLRRFADDSAREFFHAIRGLSAAEQSEFMSALVRRWQKHAMASKGESLSDRDQMWIDRYLAICGSRLSQLPEPYAERGPRLTAGQLVKALKASPTPPLASQKISRHNGIWMEYIYREHTITTIIDFGGISRRMEFAFWLSDSEGKRLLYTGTDPLSWLGIGRSGWYAVRSDQAPMIVETIAASLMRFCSATDYILDGNLPTGEVSVR